MKPCHAAAVALLGLVLVCFLSVPGAMSQEKAMQFEPTWESLKQYSTAGWFQNAKFGIFIHWGVYSVPAFGSEWYPREMYVKGSAVYKHHIETYGPQATFGYKDFIPMFRAEKWDPERWADIFKRSGAKYVVPVAEHHDGFQMYASALSRWNAATMGPQRDIIGELAKAVRKRGLVFGLSSHRAEHWWFMNGGMQIPSDVRDSTFAGLYGPARPDTAIPDKRYLDNWYARCKELVDKYQPQLFYFDWWIEQPVFAPYLQKFSSYYYNKARDWNEEVVINYKNSAFPDRTAVLDIERGRLNEIRLMPWQTDTSIGKKSWGYIRNEENKSAGELVDILVDIVSKNGCLLLNIGPRSDGTIPEEQERVLLDMGSWLQVNGEAIYDSRPWQVYGEGVREDTEGMFSEARSKPYTSSDIRFTSKGKYVYAVCLDWPGETLRIKNLRPVAGSSVILLGYPTPLSWEWENGKGLLIHMPKELQTEAKRPCKYAYALKVEGTRAPVADMPTIRGSDGNQKSEQVFADSVRVELNSSTPGATLYYTIDGAIPSERSQRYVKPFALAGGTTVRAIATKDGYVSSPTSETKFHQTQIIRNINYAFPYNPKYHAEGDLTLADGRRGTANFNDGAWLGFEKDDLDVTVELKRNESVSKVCVGCLEDQRSWIFLPTGLEVLTSADGEHYVPAGKMSLGVPQPNGLSVIKDFCVDVKQEHVRFLRLRALNVGVCPEWHGGAGSKAWLFVDELTIQ